jgi:L-alanine-DL-glutamate epimerase-like enolase superfamily enzyme
MKITDVKVYALSAPINDPYRIAGHTINDVTATLVEIESDTGLRGYGEALTRLGPTVAREVVSVILKPILMNADPMNVDVLWERMFATMSYRGHWKGFMLEAMSGVDIALWDLMGKALNQSVSSLLGGRHREEVEAYGSSILHKDRAAMVEEAHDVVQQGYRKLKVKVGMGVETDFANVKAIREAVGPDIGIMLDANSGYDAETSLKLGYLIEPLDIIWLEEPVPPYDYEGYRKLSERLRVPIVGGECEFTRWGFRDLIIRGKVAMIQPDICRCGGFTEGRKIAALASAHGIAIAPHYGASSAVSIAASLHYAASLSNLFVVEQMFTENALREGILKDPILRCVDGKMTVPTGPGLGIELDFDKINEYLLP